jgi:YihY family inner membrane protein
MLEQVGRLSARPKAAVRGNLGRHRIGRALLDVVDESIDGPLLHYASAMAFDLFLGSIPLLALAGWLFGRLLADDSALRAVSLLLNSSPVQVQALAHDELGRFAPEMLAPVAVAGALWLGSSACATCMHFLELRAGGRRRPWWERRLISLLWVIASLLLFGLGSAFVFAVVGGPVRVLQSLFTPETANRTAYALAVALLYLLAGLWLAAFYRIVLHARGVKRRVFVGAVFAIALTLLASFGFAIYVAQLARYALYYGTLSAVAITMVWLWLLCFFVLAGAEFLLSYDESPPSSRVTSRTGV